MTAFLPPSSSRPWKLAALLVVSGLALSNAEAAPHPNDALVPFLGNHCYDCHDSTTKKGGLNLEEMSSNLNNPDTMAQWIKVHDRLKNGEMPPKKKDTPPAEESSAFLGTLSKSLIAADNDRAAKEGRSTWRRLNRFEYENSVRDLLDAPWLQLRDILPEDGEAHRYNKSGSALDISHVQLARYMQAADIALRDVIATVSNKPQAKVERYYAREQSMMVGKMFYGEFNRSAVRATFPLLGTDAQPDVISKKAPPTVGDKNPDIRDLEAIGVVASNYEPIELRFNAFRAPMDGRYKIRLRAQTFTARPEKKNYWNPDRDHCFPGQRDEPVSLYAVGARSQRKIGGFDVTIDPTVNEIEAILRKGETIGPDAARLFRSRPPNFHNPLATPSGTPGVAYRWLEVEGPLYEQWPPAGHKTLFGDLPFDPSKKNGIVIPNDPETDAKRLLAAFITKAYRRPVESSEVERFLPVVKAARASGSNFTDAMIAGYTAVLCSPGFLYLEEPVGKLDDHSLASRLSYFLWNSPPDGKLLELATAGKLSEPATLRAQTDRMIGDPKARRFFSAFLDYWLDLRKMDAASPDSTLYPDYYLDELLTESAIDETNAFFEELVRNNLPAKNIVDSNFIFANEHLAEHYGIPDIQGVKIRKILLPENSPRGGFLTQASVLKVTANGTTTSPVIRGNWIRERILGQTTPPPPPGTPAVEPDIRGAKTIRQQLEMHRSEKSCASCHATMDPPGFALESFDVLGGWRDKYRALGDPKTATPGFGKNGQPFTFHNGLPVDPTGTIPSLGDFTDIRTFKKLILSDERQIARNIAKQFITYSTGTPVRFGDRAALEAILDRSRKSGYGVRSIIQEIIQSPIFLNK